MSNQLIFSPYTTDCTNGCILLDYSLRELDKNDNLNIYFVYLDDKYILFNDFNLSGSHVRQKEISFDNYLLTHKHKAKRLHYIPISHLIKKEVCIDFNFSELESVKSISYKNVNIGYGVVSTFVSSFLNINPIESAEYKLFINNLLNSCANITDALLELLLRISFDKIVTFNGRYATLRPAIEIAILHNIDYSVLEIRPYNKLSEFRWHEYPNCLPHSITYYSNIIPKLWEQRTKEDEHAAFSFFERRAKGLRAGDQVYITSQKSELLPSDWDDSKTNICFFSSSEDEFFSIGKDWDEKKIFANQEDAMLHIAGICSIDDNIKLYLRVHPHLKGRNYSYAKFSKLQCYKNVTIIPPESPISTYSLLMKCDKCITCGSTMGCEATFWGKPSILLGGALYYNINATYNPLNEMELQQLLLSTLEPKPRTNALKYSNCMFFSKLGNRPLFVNFEPYFINFRDRRVQLPNELKIIGSKYLYLLSKFIFRLLNIRNKYAFNNKIRNQLIIEK